jgi:hypothetical protein
MTSNKFRYRCHRSFGMPDLPSREEVEAFEAETRAIQNSFGEISESLEEELARRQNQALADRQSLAAIEAAKAIQQDEFESELRAESDATTEQLYEAQPRKRKNP